jgi:hypothetical protein
LLTVPVAGFSRPFVARLEAPDVRKSLRIKPLAIVTGGDCNATQRIGGRTADRVAPHWRPFARIRA